jgi:NAD(P)-dependent dehydrogenase (short-subunit alcohol dehydrogenase family)
LILKPGPLSDTFLLSNYTLDGKTAIVTGAGQGMGEAFAKILAANGASVAVADVNGEASTRVAGDITRSGKHAASYPVNVSHLEDVTELVTKVTVDFGSPDILVNNAGLLKPTPFLEIGENEWRNVMNVNVDGVFFCCKAVALGMISRRYGKIVNISSTAGKSASTFGGLHYTASKAAVLGITRHLARELAQYGVNVNAVCPGSIDTPMIRGNASEETIQKGIEKIPFARLGKPTEVANLVLFLASDASSYITGASIDINGGELLV